MTHSYTTTTTLSPLEAEVLKIIEDGFQDYKEIVGPRQPTIEERKAGQTESPVYVPQVHLLPQFVGLKYLTTFRLKQIDPDTVKPGSINCIYSSAFTPANTAHLGRYWAIGSPHDVARLASLDFDWYKKNIRDARFTLGGKTLGMRNPVAWTPPNDFNSSEAISAFRRTMDWNDDRGYDDEKRQMLRLALQQELESRKRYA